MINTNYIPQYLITTTPSYENKGNKPWYHFIMIEQQKLFKTYMQEHPFKERIATEKERIALEQEQLTAFKKRCAIDAARENARNYKHIEIR